MSIDRRVVDLEAEAFRARGQHHDVHERLDHLTAAIGDLSQDSRALALDVREVRTELHEVHTKIDALTAEVRAGFATLAAALENRLAPRE